MTNHVYLIVYINNSPLSTVMQNINFRYAKWVNKERKSIGHLFQARFHSLLVTNESYLINLCRYIHLNPLTAKMVMTLEDYKWSSHKNYMSDQAPSWLNISTMKHTIDQVTKQNYADFMVSPLEKEKWKPALCYSQSGKIVLEDTLIKNANGFSYKIKSRKKYHQIILPELFVIF